MISDKWLLCVFLCLLWVATDANAESTTANSSIEKAATTQPATTQPATTQTTTTIVTTIGIPGNVEEVQVVERNESSITLSWNKVNSIPTYYLKYENKEEFINKGGDETNISFVVRGLTAGTTYRFTVITFNGRNSTGTQSDETFTLPRNAEEFRATDQNETSITLQWNKVENDQYILRYGSEEETFTVSEETVVTRTILNLSNMTVYDFKLSTVFQNTESSGVNVTAYTAPPNPGDLQTVGQNETSITLRWSKVGDLRDYVLMYDGNEENVSADAGGGPVTKTIDGLTPAKEYIFSLFAVFNNVRSSGVIFSAVTAPRDTIQFLSVDQNETSITLQWQKVDNLLDYIISVNGNETTHTATADQDTVTYEASGLTTATRYEFVLFTVFENVKSRGVRHTAVTAPRNSEDFRAVGQDETSITLQWTQISDFFSYTLQYDGNETNISASEDQVTVRDLEHTTNYNFTLFTVFENVRSSGVNIPAATAPPNTEQVTAIDQKESSITLQWTKVGALLDYILEYDGEVINVAASPGDELVTEEVPGLSSGTWYNFKVFAVFETVRSSGKDFRNATVPSQVEFVNVTERSANSLTLEWKNVRTNWSYSLNIDERVLQPTTSEDVVSEVIPSLQPGTKYPFTVITNFAGLRSTAYESFTITKLDCANAIWEVTNSSISARIEGLFTNATASNVSHTHNSHGESNVQFTGLYPGATYEVSLDYENTSEPLNQCKHKLTIKPPNLVAYCQYWDSGYSVYVGWNKPAGIWSSVEVEVKGSTNVSTNGEQHVIIPGFQPAKTHKISVTSVSGGQKSTSYDFSCATDPRGVIAGSFFGVLIFLALVCLAAFVLLKRPDLIRRNKPFIGGTKKNKKPKAIPVDKFKEHVYQLGMDENRGFGQEYESLMPIGTEQTRRDALLPENKPKNRFNNVLPYDWCRVKLTSSDANGTSDYINANYMPGFKNNREYIATQGPLPSTVDDFWRMIWEQRVKGIVMVTNCKESGKTKCEQYWPGDRQSHLYGDLTVTIRSEQIEPNWTLREFGLKHRIYSEERKVKHFHFTAWPDHGVPQGTQNLIQFRGLVRQHIDREGSGAPTVVHCSAGVGRTGTIIALDVLLQQLERDRAVGIKGFVHNMRLSRPHMVQTESQYVFLHQCIMDTLQQNEISEENIYENDSLYVNATALRDFHKGSQV